MSSEHCESPRRSSRVRTQPKKFGFWLSPVKRRLEKEESSEEDDFTDGHNLQKPVALFSQDDVEGQDMFKFKARHTKQDLQNKVKAAIRNSPRADTLLKTPRKSFHRGSFGIQASGDETPKHVQDILKKRIKREVDSDSSDGDFSASSDEFQPEDSDEARHTKQDLQNKVKAAISNSPRADTLFQTPSGSFGIQASGDETPKHVQDILKKRIKREVDSDSSDGDFSASSDEFQPEDSDEARHTKQDLQNKVKAAISNSPRADTLFQTPSGSFGIQASGDKTPKHVQDILKKRIKREVDSDSSDGDFSASSDEFQPEDSDEARHTKQDLQNKVKAAISNSPRADTLFQTPSGSFGIQASGDETPKHVQDILKKRIKREVDSDSSDGDFSASSDEFQPEDSDESSSSSSSESEPQHEQIKPKAQAVRSTRARAKDSEYIVTPDNYFLMHSTKKITTSDHTLARLKNMNLSDNLDQHIQLSTEHKERINELNESYEQFFDKWLYVLSENFSVILYGIGSKKSVLHKFQQEKLQEFPCIVINGFFPSLTIKSILETIIIDLLNNTNVPSNIGDVVNIIETQLDKNGTDLFLIVHNIDGPMLRNGECQAMLAAISQIRNVHTIATIDHINAPLLWDHSKLSKFNFKWWDVTTFLPYSEETSFENSLLTQRSGALPLSSLRSVYQSLTTNAKGVFNVIIQHQLDNHKLPHYQGLPFKDLYSKCREQFLVNSDLALRAQLTEFLDHKLVRMKRTHDGSENLLVPIDNALLLQFAEQQND